MSISIQQQQKEKLEANNKISYKEVCEILDAFQIASGQGFAIGKTKALLDFLKEGKSIIIKNFDYSDDDKKISSIKQLVNIYKDIDQFIDLTTDKDFKQYFS
jgi:hypothetical protein